jgi:hypothetical protein
MPSRQENANILDELQSAVSKVGIQATVSNS